ncbi:ATP synthase subunit I [Amphibacillus indicireducens]|uniref:ATP synthase subunit I n=1 Tax=Amphibacillus indicireducens TaxID=1076330 RepID=A0ABP7VNZ3_9BACI
MKLSDLAKRMIITILIIATVSTLGSVIYHRSLDFLPFLIGATLGSAVSISKVILLEHAVNKALKMERKTAGNYVTIQHVLRLLLSGVAFLIGALVPQVSLWGVVAGILAFQVAVYSVRSTTKN